MSYAQEHMDRLRHQLGTGAPPEEVERTLGELQDALDLVSGSYESFDDLADLDRMVRDGTVGKQWASRLAGDERMQHDLLAKVADAGREAQQWDDMDQQFASDTLAVEIEKAHNGYLLERACSSDRRGEDAPARPYDLDETAAWLRDLTAATAPRPQHPGDDGSRAAEIPFPYAKDWGDGRHV